MTSVVLICATGAASLYAAGSLHVKRSMTAGANSRRTIATTNIAMALWALPIFFICARNEFDLNLWLSAVGAGVALFLGRILSVKALEIGDLSIVGPLLGMKTLLVAVFSSATGQAELSTGLWVATILATLGVILLQRGPRSLTRNRRIAAMLAAGASILFAACDILVVEARQLGIGWVSPTLFITVALLVPFLGKHPPAPDTAKKPMYLGATIMGFQTTLVILLIGLTGQAVLINIVYSTRALWTVVVDRFYGRGEGVVEFFKLRMVGAVLLVSAIAVVVFAR